MSRNDSTGRGRRTAFTLATAAGGAMAAAMFGMGMAHAVPSGDEGYSILFGGDGTDPNLFSGQAADNLTLDTELYDQNPGDAASFDTAAASFETQDGHAIEDLINSIDPTAYSDQITPGITGTLPDGAYLVPESSLGYLGTELDFFLLNPTGLDFLLTPVVELLLGSPEFGF
jgi:hypothetical protein